MTVITDLKQRPCYLPLMQKAVTAHPFGKKLATLRKQRGLSQTELGKIMGFSRGMIAYYEGGAKNPTVEVIENAAKALNVSIATLLENPIKSKPGPQSKLEQLTQRLSELPRSKQKVVIEMLEGFLDKAS